MNITSAIVPSGPINLMSSIAPSGQVDGNAHTVELDAGLLQQLGWTNIWYDIQEKISEELDQARKVRPLLPLSLDSSLDPEAIPDYTTKTAGGPGSDVSPKPFHIPLRPRMVSVLISSEFKISTAQIGDAGVALHLVAEAARRVGQAEDAVLLYGRCLADKGEAAFDGALDVALLKDWKDTPLGSWDRLHIHPENLQQQDRFLFHYEYEDQIGNGRDPFLPPVKKNEPDQWYRIDTDAGEEPASPGDVPRLPPVAANEPAESLLRILWQQFERLRADVDQQLRKDSAQRPDILDILLNGIKKLQTAGHFGEYCAVVAPDLYKAAFAPRSSKGTAWDDKREAPIYQIRPLLREGGFGYSRMLMPGTGVLFSVGGGALTLAVPREAHVQFVSMDRDVTLSVQERIRLLINRTDAVVPLCKNKDYPE